ncbi:hypothetical protein A2419_00060 [Candidatus Adlerbacteria bacterium RIFOXYC1_FULL_48_26]|uniref:Uncharacterized protein n=1 Tax=Candidatus Adlerbacteria bacterium RIFOXYC1_FULL_48_26 TaxID=1797247 RepID=A0A1F4Y2Q5_9BACT|nr:MAG: hypothetical protein A2419_00060 [Candidatus Adlerbacteria bacterium RIFOXYC1_FULL_48_26]OGC93375.1 MAG: hypothetical protein A2389_02855 [Candidatus Adlerbacteria bacterium RIFOXYB1_FULL_48_10]OGC96096.1 MAG: hypothetical protein A2590_00400 [Candidatus Adlerbacteria bacterium RIFOXYD1_FULL_48_8]
MGDTPVASQPPVGKKKYRATFRKVTPNPFRGRGMVPAQDVQEVEVDANVPFQQVQAWAREMAVGGSELVSVEEVK